MFTGIIQQIGHVAALEKTGDWTLVIETAQPLEHVALGASIACNGVCLTVIEHTVQQFKVQISGETLSKTTAKDWHVGTKLNLERALRMADELGGHLLLGHVDGVASIVTREIEGDSVRFDFDVPAEFARFLAPKGSVALDGISLTINKASGARASVNIIPHTQKMTNAGDWQAGDKVNFEIDMMARYIDRLLEKRS